MKIPSRLVLLACNSAMLLQAAEPVAENVDLLKQRALERRAAQVMQAVTSDIRPIDGTQPMHYWIAQRLFEQEKRRRRRPSCGTGSRQYGTR